MARRGEVRLANRSTARLVASPALEVEEGATAMRGWARLDVRRRRAWHGPRLAHVLSEGATARLGCHRLAALLLCGAKRTMARRGWARLALQWLLQVGPRLAHLLYVWARRGGRVMR